MAPTPASGPELLASPNLDGTAVSWMQANWMFVAWAGALLGLGVLVGRLSARPALVRDPYWYGWLGLVMYLFHQAEEHGYDFRGWRYSFVPYLNDGIGAVIFSGACAAGGGAGCPLDPKITLYVNTVLIWAGFGGCMVVAHLRPERFLLAGSLSWGTAVVNGLGGHILPALAGASYNPGLVQSLVMVPLGIFVVRASGRPWLCLASGLAAHVVAFGAGLNLVLRAGLPEAATLLFSALAGAALPLGVAWYVRHPPDAYKYEAL